jgi:hypothetical protein
MYNLNDQMMMRLLYYVPVAKQWKPHTEFVLACMALDEDFGGTIRRTHNIYSE